uniref:Rbsn domain-containing protein n=1 Tax=Syphacia muris TaxID=451379 RepID=A0A0N5AS89_9BILA
MSCGIGRGIAPSMRGLKQLMKETPMLPTVDDESAAKFIYERYLDKAIRILHRIGGKVAHLEKRDEAWRKLISTSQGDERDEEERLYGEMAEDPEGMIQTVDEVRKVILDLKLEIKKIGRKLGLNNKVFSSKADESTNRIRKQNPSGERSQLGASKNLPKLIMPTFDGKPEGWPAF